MKNIGKKIVCVVICGVALIAISVLTLVAYANFSLGI